MIDEGYTKFELEWSDRAPIADARIPELDHWRARLLAAGLIGRYEDSGIGYGNLSIREPGARRFLITGTQTGHLRTTGPDHYALVTDYDIDANRVVCQGASAASSETLTHAAIYELDRSICAVVHVHDLPLWQSLLDDAPTTRAGVAYGTPEMAREFTRLWQETAFAEVGVAAMAGHEAGIVGIGAGLAEAAVRVLDLHARRGGNATIGDPDRHRAQP